MDATQHLACCRHHSKCFICTHICYFHESVSVSTISNSLPSHGLWPTRFLCPWNSPGKNTGVGSNSLLQGILPTQGSNPGLPQCRQIFYICATREAPYKVIYYFLIAAITNCHKLSGLKQHGLLNLKENQ